MLSYERSHYRLRLSKSKATCPSRSKHRLGAVVMFMTRSNAKEHLTHDLVFSLATVHSRPPGTPPPTRAGTNDPQPIANPDGTPGDLAAEYYGQRASLGLIITEGTQPSEDGQGYMNTPGIYTPGRSKAGERSPTRCTPGGGAVFIQLMHAGRMSHPDNTPHHRLPVAPSAISADQEIFTPPDCRRRRCRAS